MASPCGRSPGCCAGSGVDGGSAQTRRSTTAADRAAIANQSGGGRRLGRRPAGFCQEQTHVLAEQFSSMEHDAFRVQPAPRHPPSRQTPEAVIRWTWLGSGPWWRTGPLGRAGIAATHRWRAGFQAHDGYIFETLTARGGVLVGVHKRAADALGRHVRLRRRQRLHRRVGRPARG